MRADVVRQRRAPAVIEFDKPSAGFVGKQILVAERSEIVHFLSHRCPVRSRGYEAWPTAATTATTIDGGRRQLERRGDGAIRIGRCGTQVALSGTCAAPARKCRAAGRRCG